MITTVVIADAPMDIASPVSSRATIIVTPELLLKRRAQLH
jgi:hypothetical protein